MRTDSRPSPCSRCTCSSVGAVSPRCAPRRGQVVDARLHLPGQALADLAGQPHRPGQVGDHLVERGAGPWSRSTAGYTPRAITRKRSSSSSSATRARPARPAPGPAGWPPASRPSAAVERPVQRGEPVRGRVRQLADQAAALDLRARVSRRRDSRSSRGQLVGPAHALAQLDAALHAAQQEPAPSATSCMSRWSAGVIGHVRLVDRQRGPQLRAVEHRDHVVGVGPGEQHREVVRGRRRPSRRPGRPRSRPAAVDGQPDHGALRAGALGEHLGQAGQRLLQRAGPDPRGRLRQHRVRRGEPVVGEPPDEPVDRLAGRDHPGRRHPRGHERQQHPAGPPRRRRRARPPAPGTPRRPARDQQQPQQSSRRRARLTAPQLSHRRRAASGGRSARPAPAGGARERRRAGRACRRCSRCASRRPWA